MAHGAEPWWDLAIRLMLKYPNLHLMTSAHRPKYLPEQLLHFMRTRGTDRIMFSADLPLLSLETCLADVAALDLPDEVKHAYLHGNADRVFFGATPGPVIS